MTDSRLCAFRVLKAVSGSGAFSPQALDAEAVRMKLSAADTALAANIVYGTLEREKLLDAAIGAQLRKKGRLNGDIRVILRLSAFQLLFCDKIPSFSAINEGVELAKRVDPRLGGFVNGVLRSIDRSKGEVCLPDRESKPEEYISVRYSVEPWMARLWMSELGLAETESMLLACENRPPITARVNTLKTDTESLIALLAEEGVGAEKHRFVPDMLCLSGTGSIDSLTAYQKGLLHIQDAASAFCCAVVGAMPGESVLDICSAPGGKSFTLAEMMQNSGSLTAYDISGKKLGLVSSGAERLGISIITTRVRDGAAADMPLPAADRVLCDVPCSGLGVIRRKPEIRRKPFAEAETLPPIQYAILENAAGAVRSGGVLVYSTCTLRSDENERVAEKFLKNHPEFAPLPFELPLSEKKQWYASLRPDVTGTDGFFVARMVKI